MEDRKHCQDYTPAALMLDYVDITVYKDMKRQRNDWICVCIVLTLVIAIGVAWYVFTLPAPLETP